MNFIDIDLATESLTPRDCNFISDKNYPFCLLGFQLKNAYDQTRLIFRDEYKIRDYVHFLPDSEATPMFFRGIRITPKASFNNLFIQLDNFNTSLTELPIRHYERIISSYSLSCKNCYGSMQRGVYPIDGECINDFAKNNINLDDLYSNAFDVDKVPIFQSCAYFTIFILCNKSIYRVNTDKIMSSFQENILV
jgi:hypothetical protein